MATLPLYALVPNSPLLLIACWLARKRSPWSMACSASAVIIPFEALPSGMLSRVSLGRARAVPAIPSAPSPWHRKRRRVHIPGPPASNRSRSQTLIFPSPLFGDGRIILLEHILVLGHELLPCIGVHVLPKPRGQLAPDIFIQ